MRKHDNSDAYFNIQNETVLQRVDYDSFADQKPFRPKNSSREHQSWQKQPVQLDIEIELNESLQLLLNSPDSSRTPLIDVTLIRETPSSPETTVSLGKPEVKLFLDMVSRNQDSRDYPNKQKLKESKTEERKAIYQPYNQTTTDEENQPIDCIPCEFQNSLQTESTYTESTDKALNDHLPNRNHQYHRRHHEKIYASPDMFTKLRSSLTCEHNKRHSGDNQKPGTPCLCQHCGMIGVLIESQKRPFIPHPVLPEACNQHRPRSGRKKNIRRQRTSVNVNSHEYLNRYRQENYHTTEVLPPQDTLFEDLLSKLQSLEERVLAQEEKSVGKDYFQYVIRKMLSQYIAKMVQSELPDSVKTSSTQYSRIYLDESEICRSRGRHRQKPHLSFERDSSGTNTRESSVARRNVNAERKKHNETGLKMNSVPDKDYNGNPKNKNVRYFDNDDDNDDDTDPAVCTRKHWKDIRTQKDLKDRILSLIEGELGYKKRRDTEVSLTPEKLAQNKEIKVESFQNTICLPQVIHSGRMLAEATRSDKNRPINNSAFKDLLDSMSSQIYEDLLQSKHMNRSYSPLAKPEQPKYNNMEKALDDTLFKRNIEASKKRGMQFAKYNNGKNYKRINMNAKGNTLENVDLKYMNPAADIWGESSTAELAKTKHNRPADKSESKIYAKDSLTYKIEYMKGLARSKNIKEEDLWRSIWRQTKNRFKSKDDILTISIPSRKRTKRPFELELTWSELKEIMQSTKSKPSQEVSSCDKLHNKKKKRDHSSSAKQNHSYKPQSKSAR